ncbi:MULTISPECIES: hypothetical protein [Peribacillus]|uniref:Sporulation protein n=1 Tax=Peribacillus simplex TaxID=1478 RepID=A0A9W4KR85_9BACI|nr:hypothetical protein [Peribacillus simplex]MDR4929003.1 hypothetical protein [Peribacillus simplex]WHX91227.1 hypothetical protein QNH50_25365 [Peribacillus simplex]CAH0128656.1 hypothetical protein SRABI133_00178 [Peribacillus simplex]
MKSKLLIMTAFLLAGLTACGQNDNAINNDSEYGDQSRDGRDFVGKGLKQVSNNDWDNEAERPSDQVLNTPHHTSNNSPSMGQQIDEIRGVIDSETNYEAGSVWFNGNTIHVTVHDKGQIKTEKKRNEEKQRIQGMINRVVPQYNLDVKLKK